MPVDSLLANLFHPLRQLMARIESLSISLCALYWRNSLNPAPIQEIGLSSKPIAPNMASSLRFWVGISSSTPLPHGWSTFLRRILALLHCYAPPFVYSHHSRKTDPQPDPYRDPNAPVTWSCIIHTVPAMSVMSLCLA